MDALGCKCMYNILIMDITNSQVHLNCVYGPYNEVLGPLRVKDIKVGNQGSQLDILLLIAFSQSNLPSS